MTFYDILRTYILPPMGDLTLYDGYGEKALYYIFTTAVCAIAVHFFLVVPYKLVLRLVRYKGWLKR